MSRDFQLLVFFMNQFPPSPLSIPLGPFRIFSKIRSSRCTTSVVDTGGKWKKSSIIKVLIIMFGHLWFATGIVDTGGKLAASIIDTGGKFATGINNTSKTGGKICSRCRWYQWQIFRRCLWYQQQFLPPVSLTPVMHLDLRISPRILKIIEAVLIGYSEAGGKLIHEKKKQKISWHCPLRMKIKTDESVEYASMYCKVLGTRLEGQRYTVLILCCKNILFSFN